MTQGAFGELVVELTRHVTWSGGASDPLPSVEGILPGDLRELLSVHDGLIAFEGGLRCFGMKTGLLPSLKEWNRPEGWRSAYRGLSGGLFFFAEDAFGNQFAIEDERVVRFLAETAEREFITDSIADWLGALLQDAEEELSLWLLREWKNPDRVLEPTEHLCPKVPFVTGGSYEASNLYALDRNESMIFKGDFAWQTRNLPQGAKIRLKVAE
jgi:hypothetical protein